MNPSILRRRIIGLAGGALWLIAISGAFVIWSLLAIGTPRAKLVLAVTVTVIAAIVAINVVVLRMAMRLPKGINGQKSEKKKLRRRFVWIVGAELAAFAAINIVAAAARQFELIPLLILIVVGIHFFPLARIFHVPRYYMTGLLFCAVPIITLIWIPKESVFGQVPAWYVVPNLGCGLAASLTAVAGLFEAWQSLSRSSSMPE